MHAPVRSQCGTVWSAWLRRRYPAEFLAAHITPDGGIVGGEDLSVPDHAAKWDARTGTITALGGYAGELARWGIETTIVVPSALGPGHYVRSGRPRDTVRAEAYADGPTADIRIATT